MLLRTLLPAHRTLQCYAPVAWRRLFALLVLGVLTMVWAPPSATGQPKAEVASEQAAARAADAVAQSVDAAARDARATRQGGPLSFRSFVRGGRATGNLLRVPYVTNGNISAGYWGGTVQPNKIQWPGASGVEYGHTMSFMVAGQVVNAEGDSVIVISDSYNRSGGDTAPDGSHKYFWNALPGYYNMQGSRSTPNQLNNNSDDRRILDATGYYYVGGLPEDANENGQLDDGEDLNGNGRLDDELENTIEFTAQSNLPETWPTFWPPGSYPGDGRAPCDFAQGTSCAPGPGVRAGRWNGAFGAFVRADQEAYYVFDDRDNDEFDYAPFVDPTSGGPDLRPWRDGGRRGLGVEVTVRQYQWASVLAEDLFIATFDVENVSRQDIPRSIIAMIVDYDIADETSDNQALFDTKDDITYQWIDRELVINGFRVGYGGVGFLESPGLPEDGLDNDEDGLTDEGRDNGIDDDGDWRIWTDVDGDGRPDNEDANNNFVLDPGEDADGDGRLTIEPLNDDVGSDGLGPDDENYPGPDPDGSEANGRPDPGEPNFEFTDNDEIDQIGLTGMVIRTPSDFDRDLDDDATFWRDYIQPGTFVLPIETPDIIYVYSSGYTAIPQGRTQRFSLAFFCGNDFQDMLRNKRTMQNIYDADYNFAKPPRPPFLTAVPGDERVTLVWDQSAESSRDPIYGTDFEMYKVYRSTDPSFNEIKTITDAFGNPLLWEPLTTATGDKAQYDLDNGLAGPHPVPLSGFGVSYDMGTDSGLQYSFVDSTVQNGRTYYYAVVSVDQGYHSSFFERGISPLRDLADASPTESSKVIEVDALDRPTNVGQNAAVVQPQRPALGYEPPRLVGDGIERTGGDATGTLDVDFLVPDTTNSLGYTYEFFFSDDGAYAALDSVLLANGRTAGFVLRRRSPDGAIDTLATHTAAKPEDVFDTPTLTARLYDGMRFILSGPSHPVPVDAQWLDPEEPGSGAITRETARPSARITVREPDGGAAVPVDYELRVDALGADTSNSLGPTNRIPTNFTLMDVTEPSFARRLPFQLTEPAEPLLPADTVRGRLSPGDVVNARISGVDLTGYRYYARTTWQFEVGLSDEGAAFMGEAQQYANALYDSLAVRDVRGMAARPYGADLSVLDLDDFFAEVDAWYEVTLDSLLALPSLRPLLTGQPAPAAFLDGFERLAQNEIPQPGDRFFVRMSKPFDRDDVLRFTVEGHRMASETPENALDDVYVVPDPYVAVNPLESQRTLLASRPERRLDFRNLPPECTIRIFTMSGRPVKTIEHQASGMRASTATWDLRSDDGLDVAYGVYIYHVEAPGIGETIGRFSIIK